MKYFTSTSQVHVNYWKFSLILQVTNIARLMKMTLRACVLLQVHAMLRKELDSLKAKHKDMVAELKTYKDKVLLMILFRNCHKTECDLLLGMLSIIIFCSLAIGSIPKSGLPNTLANLPKQWPLTKYKLIVGQTYYEKMADWNQ